MDYEIVVLGHIDKRRFRGITEIAVEHTPGGESRITCQGFDQASLHAVINRIFELGLNLLAVTYIAQEK